MCVIDVLPAQISVILSAVCGEERVSVVSFLYSGGAVFVPGRQLAEWTVSVPHRQPSPLIPLSQSYPSPLIPSPLIPRSETHRLMPSDNLPAQCTVSLVTGVALLGPTRNTVSRRTFSDKCHYCGTVQCHDPHVSQPMSIRPALGNSRKTVSNTIILILYLMNDNLHTVHNGRLFVLI